MGFHRKIALTLSVLAVAVMWVQRHNVMDLLGWVAVFVLISLLVNVRTSVQIIDNSDLVGFTGWIMCLSDWRCHFH